VFQITELNPGDAYEPKVPDRLELSIQVGVGGDCGVFIGKCEARTFQKPPAFRVLVNQKDLRKHWKKIGTYELGSELQRYAFYGDADFGSQARYKVTLENADGRVVIDEAEFQKLERLSAWNTVHILARIKEGKNWF
jgi:hypothetical protein